MSIATLLSQHHQVTAVDIIPEKVDMINNRKSPIQDDYIEKYLAEKELNLTATLDAKAAYSYSIAYYFVLFSMLGLANYGNRAVAQCRDNQKNLNETFSNIVTLHIAFSFICCVVYILYVFFLANEKLYAGIQFAYVLSGLFDVSWFYFGIEKFKLTVTRNIIIKILNVVCVFVFVRNANDLWKYCAIMAAGMLISQISLWFPLNKFVAFHRAPWTTRWDVVTARSTSMRSRPLRTPSSIRSPRATGRLPTSPSGTASPS